MIGLSWTGGVPPANTPIVNSVSMNFAVPGEFQQAVGQATATNTPTSWAITSGNTGSVFAIDNSGNITANANLSLYSPYSTGVQATTYTLGVSATNGNGSGNGTITVVCTNLPFPSTATRPQYSGGTITWTGPVGGGPSTVNDVQQSHALSVHSGDLSSTAAGQTFQYLDITGNVNNLHNNLTLKNCRVQGTYFSTASVPANGVGGTQPTGQVIEDCVLGGIDGPPQGYIGNLIVRRCYFANFENEITKYFRSIIIKDNMFDLPNGADCDQNEISSNVGSNNIVMCNNTYAGTDNVPPGSVYNSAINMSNFPAGSIGPNVYIDRCYFTGTVHSHTINDDNQFSATTVTFGFSNNAFLNAGLVTKIGRNNGISPNSGNFISPSGGFTGTLINSGTGVF